MGTIQGLDLSSSNTGITGTLGIPNGGTGTSATFATGSVLFATTSGVLSGNATALFWNNTSSFLYAKGYLAATPLMATTIATPQCIIDVSNNTAASPAPFNGTGGIRLVGADGVGPVIGMDAVVAAGTFYTRRANGSLGSPAVVTTGNPIQNNQAFGWSGAAYTQGAAYRVDAMETFNATSAGSVHVFRACAPATTTLATVSQFDGNGVPLFGSDKRVTTNFSTATTVLANVTGLSVVLSTGNTFGFESILYATAGSTGGTQVAIAGSATVSSIVYDAQGFGAGALVGQGRATAAGGAIIISTSAVTPTIRIVGTITVGNAGTITTQIAQVASTTTSTVILAGSTMRVFQIT